MKTFQDAINVLKGRENDFQIKLENLEQNLIDNPKKQGVKEQIKHAENYIGSMNTAIVALLTNIGNY